MENSIPSPKFSPGDYVVYENRPYEIKQIVAVNWFSGNPFVYGISMLDTDPKEPYHGKILMVREALLNAAKDQELSTWRTLYAKRKS